MDVVKILRKTKIKQVITPQSKEALQQKFENRKSKHQTELDQLHFEKKKMLHQKRFPANQVEKRFNQEEERRKRSIEWCKYQLEQLEILPIGSEIVEGEVEEIIELSVGDSWDDIAGNREIVIKDGIIEKINR
ncbi:hypothetical protein FPQ10_02050 [Allobacillus sp. SKP2-8]|nr:hypothetical protein FPQ10_02050 [Allobacillus sp. SKP2-8]